MDIASELDRIVKCADEGRWCLCPDGDIIFAQGRFGELYAPDLSPGSFVRIQNASGQVKCDVGSFGYDPAPYGYKACFCTPCHISELVAEQGPLKAVDCAILDDDAYFLRSIPSGRSVVRGLQLSDSLASLKGSGEADRPTIL